MVDGDGKVTGEASEEGLDAEATLAAEVGNTPSMLFAMAGTPPRSIGRFTIIRELGAGSMGTVYIAYDDALDRRVAVKVLHTGRAQGKDRAQERGKEKERAALIEARVRREAMALALSETLARSFALGHEVLSAETSLALLSVIDDAGRYDEALRWAPTPRPCSSA